MKKKKVWGVMILFLLSYYGVLFTAHAAGHQIKWGEVKEGVYSPLHPYTLLWSGDVLESGGFNLT
ncbi:MAG: hypothetical protein IMW85_09980, partial [Thermicanus sp.]|nr:hypothetical protein [Thermicanus sp.]